MGARDELLAAARRLKASGTDTFSPKELIDEARRGGSNYPDSTLRTFIVGPMCLNSPDHHAVQYGDLVRVGRAQYRLADVNDTVAALAIDEPVSSPIVGSTEEAAIPAAPAGPPRSRPWYWEGNVQSALVAHLAADSWQILRVADTASRERGVDITAERDGQRLLVEVKGYPSATYTSGAKIGQQKVTSQPLHARQSFSHALLAGMLMRDAEPGARVVLAFPDFETYRTLAARTTSPLGSAGIEVWLVAEDGTVVHESKSVEDDSAG